MRLLNTEAHLKNFAVQSEEIRKELDKALEEENPDEPVVNFNEHELFIFIPPEVEYFLVQMNLLSFSSSERNAANESKC
jgi:beta-galactosidase beta subunit